MSLLLDTNALLWWLASRDRLRFEAAEIIADMRNRVYVSAASVWEIVIKVSLGKLRAPGEVASWLLPALSASAFVPLPIEIKHAVAVELLPQYHRDPFDRLLIAQAQVEGLTLVTSDPQLERYDVRVIRA